MIYSLRYLSVSMSGEYISPVLQEQGGRPNPLEEIHSKLVRDEAMRNLLGTQDILVKTMEELMENGVRSDHPEKFEGEGQYHERAVDLIYGMINKPTKVARSELLINDEARKILDGKMELVRMWLWEHGRVPQGEEKESVEESGRVVID